MMKGMAQMMMLVLTASLLLGRTCAARSGKFRSNTLSLDIRAGPENVNIGPDGEVGSMVYFVQIATIKDKDYKVPGRCALTATMPRIQLWACQYQYDLEGGSIMVQGTYKVDVPKELWTGTLAVVGGTGSYKGVSGEECQVWNDNKGTGTSTLTLGY